MSFDKGTTSFRMYHLRNKITPEDIEKFADRAAPAIETLGVSPIQGWVTWRHLFDNDITEDKCYFSPWFRITMMKAERKVPSQLLKAYCKQEEDIELRARGVDVLPRKIKAEIKDRVRDQLLPNMPPTLTSAENVVNFSTNTIYSEGTSAKQMDAFSLFFRETTKEQPYAMTPGVVALLRKQLNANDLQPTTFTDDESLAPDKACDLGLEFLTWMWYIWEKDGGNFKSRIGEDCSFMLEGPLTFYREGKGAHEALLRRGNPTLSRESGIALLCGKKLKQAKLALAIGDRVWNVTVDASFLFRSLKLPKDKENMHPSFEECMLDTDTFVNAFLDLYDKFLDIRRDSKAWELCVNDIRKWVHHHADDDLGGNDAVPDSDPLEH